MVDFPDARRDGVVFQAEDADLISNLIRVETWLCTVPDVLGGTMSAVTQRALQLALFINGPTDTSLIHDVSKELQTILLSSDGWDAANAMLAHPDFAVRFQGALSLQIKLNKQGSDLGNEEADELLKRMVSWLIQFTRADEKRLVLDKLCSSLATFFMRTPMKWQYAIRTIICSLYADEVVTQPEHLANFPITAATISQLSPGKQSVALAFCLALSEGMTSLASTSHQNFGLSDNFKSNTADAANLIHACLDSATAPNAVISLGALRCYNVWTAYAHNNWSSDPETLELLQQLTPKAIELILIPEDDLRELAVEIFVAILEYRIKFLKQEHLYTISRLVHLQIGPQCVAASRNTDQEPDTIAMGKLVAAYGKGNVKHLVATRSHASSEELIEIFQQLLTSPGFPAHDDQLIIFALEFWTEYAEHVNDAVLSSDAETLDSWLPPIRNDLLKAVGNLIIKLAPPPGSVFQEWDEEEQQQWRSFRENFGELLESVIQIPYTTLFQDCVRLATQYLTVKDWLNLEAALFCVNFMADSVNQTTDIEALRTLMASTLFSDVSDTNARISVMLKRAVLKLVDHYSEFIKSNPSYLPQVLTFLFTILETAPATQGKLADLAARSFEALCSSCRQALTQHLGELLQQCPRALTGPSANGYQKEKVMAALASIIQALPTEAAKAEPLLTLIQVIETDLNTAVLSIQQGEVEQGELLGTSALQCLANIGKGIQAPDDTSIDLDAENEGDTFWTAEVGVAIQQRILGCFEIVSYLRNAGDAIDAACEVLRAGLKETQPGPFVFPPSAVVNFVSKATLDTPRIEAVINTATTFVSASSRSTSNHLFDEVFTVYMSVARVMGELNVPNNDPQLAQLCVEFLQRLLSSYLDVLLKPSDEDIASIFHFVVSCINQDASMLKRYACSFLETLIGMARPGNPTPLPQTRIPITTIITHFSPLLASSLLHQISGQAQRSELDSLCKPLRAFIFGIPNAKKYLEDAVAQMDNEATNGPVDKNERRIFLVKLVALRGSRQTNTVVREYWAKCKGTVSSFE